MCGVSLVMGQGHEPAFISSSPLPAVLVKIVPELSIVTCNDLGLHNYCVGRTNMAQPYSCTDLAVV